MSINKKMILVFVGIIFVIIFWQEYQFYKQVKLKTFELCMQSVPNDILQNYDSFKTNVGFCKKI